MKRFLSALIVFCMLLAMLPMSASAAATYFGGCGKDLSWKLTKDTGIMEITGTGAMYNYDEDETPWDSYLSLIKSVEIASGATSIGTYAFCGCTNLTSVSIPDTVKTIGDDAFEGCSALMSLTIPSSVTKIGEYAFYSCSKLASVAIEEAEQHPSSYVIGESAFAKCTALTSITIPGSVTKLEDKVFWNCSKLDTVTLNEGLKTMGYGLFSSCTSLLELTIPATVRNCEGENGYGALANSSITKVTFAEGATSVPTYACYKATKLTTVTIPDSVTSIGEEAFDGCIALTSITLPSSLKSVGDYALCGCTALTSITIPSSVTKIGEYAFYSCTKLASVAIEEAEQHPSSYVIGESAFAKCTALTSIAIPGTVTKLEDGVFGGCSSLHTVTLSEGLKYMGASLFSGCSALTELTIPASVNSCEYVDGPFSGSSISTVTLAEGRSAIPDDMLASAVCLTEVTVPNGVKKIGEEAFCGCTKLTTVTLPASLTTIEEDAFYNCKALTDVYYLGTMSQWNGINIKDGNDWLYEATIHILTAVVTLPTCTEQGYTTYTCLCGDTYIADYVDALGHDIVVDAAVAPTCTETGLTAGEHCSRCDYKVAQEVVPALNHDLVDHEGKAATCTAKGWEAYQTCTRCNYTTYTEIAPLGHDMIGEEAVAATCTETGLTAGGHCSRCDYKIEQEVVPALGHDIVADAAVAPGCLTTGLTAGEHCTRCDYKVEQEVVPALGHDIVADAAVAPTCTTTGLTEGRHCSRCSYKLAQMVVDALGHDYRETERVEPTNGQNGYVRYKCARCDSTYVDILYPAHAHTAGAVQRENETVQTCTEWGGYDLVTYCTVCGIVLSEEHVSISPLGHDFIEINRFDSMMGETGYIWYQCTRCGFLYIEEIAPGSEEDIVIKLTWGPTPSDLDSHLYIYDSVEEAYNAQGDSVFTYNGNRGHTAYYDMEYYEDGRLAAELDYDDTSSFGPEHTTIYAPASNGIYLFKVHDYTNRDNFASRALSNSGATVELLIGDDPWLDENGNPYVFHVPADTIGCNWAVFYLDISDNSVHVLNSLEPHRLVTTYTPATCTDWGTVEYTCLDCGAVTEEIDESAPPLGHNYVLTDTVWPTDEDEGYYEYTCTRCDDWYEVPIAALTHNYVESQRLEPTCTAWGWIKSTCTVHGETMTTTIPPLGHNFQVNRVSAPNCTEMGFTSYRCLNCGDSYAADFKDPLGHDFQNGVCTRCGELDPYSGRQIVLASTTACEGGVFTIPITLVNNPGLASMRLLVQYDQSVLELQSAAIGDAFRTASNAQYLVNAETYPVVINWLQTIGQTDADDVFATLTFKVLSAEAGETAVTAAFEQADVYDGNMEDVAFEVVNSTITLGVHNLQHVARVPATCTTEGACEYWYCSVCGKIFADENASTELSEEDRILPALDHLAGDPVTENNAAPSCTEAGGYDTVVYCSRCNAEISREHVIVDALNHLAGEPVTENNVTPSCTGIGGYDTVVYCSRCNAELSREHVIVDALGHDYDYYTGVCSRCGAQDPNFPTENSPTFRIVPTSGTVGRDVTVTLRLENNPGIASAKLTLHYDAAKLAFKQADLTDFSNVQGVNFSAVDGADGVTLNYIVTSGELSGDGEFIKVTFTIAADAGAGDTPLVVTYQREDVFNAANGNVRFYCVNANLLVKLRVPGDVNGDGKVNNKDARLLFQYVSNVALTQDFFTDAADVNGDGKINNKDARLLFQYVSGMPVTLV